MTRNHLATKEGSIDPQPPCNVDGAFDTQPPCNEEGRGVLTRNHLATKEGSTNIATNFNNHRSKCLLRQATNGNLYPKQQHKSVRRKRKKNMRWVAKGCLGSLITLRLSCSAGVFYGQIERVNAHKIMIKCQAQYDGTMPTR